MRYRHKMILPTNRIFTSSSPDVPADVPVGIQAERQVGAIPYTWVKDHITYLLITSRGTGKWLFPKGNLPDDAHPRDIAVHEARQEAGVAGDIHDEPVGLYRDWKTRDEEKIPIDITMYPLRVKNQFDDWRESDQRYRHWVTLPDLRDLVPNVGLLDLVTQLHSVLTDEPVQ